MRKIEAAPHVPPVATVLPSLSKTLTSEAKRRTADVGSFAPFGRGKQGGRAPQDRAWATTPGFCCTSD